MPVRELTPDERVIPLIDPEPSVMDTRVGETSEGRRVIMNPDGSVSSERTITIRDPRINDGQWTNIPTMFGGEQVDDRTAVNVIGLSGGVDPDTKKALPFFSTLEGAESAAIQRSKDIEVQMRSDVADRIASQGPSLDVPATVINPDNTVVPAARVRELGVSEKIVEDPGALIQGAQGFNAALADFLGVFVNPLVGAMDKAGEALGIPRGLGIPGLPLRPQVGNDVARDLFDLLGFSPREDPDSIAFEAGKFTGETAMAGMGMVAGLGPGELARQAGMAAPKAAPLVTQPIRDAGRALLKSLREASAAGIKDPAKFAAAEVILGSIAGTSGAIAEREFPETEGARAIGELLGGIAPVVALGGAKVGVEAVTKTVNRLPITGTITAITARSVRQMMEAFTAPGALGRARKRVQRGTADPSAALTRIEGAASTLEGAPLTPAQRAGDRGLLELERSVMESTNVLRNQRDEQLAEVNKVIRESLQSFGGEGGLPETRATFEQARTYLDTLLEARLRAAGLAADEKIAALAPGASREAVNRIAREEIDKALTAARTQETALYNDVPDDLSVGTRRAQETLDQWLGSDAVDADPRIVPAWLRRRFTPAEGEEAGEFVGDEARIGLLRALRSRVLSDSAAAKSGIAPNRQRAKFLDEMQEAILGDIGAQRDQIEGEGGNALRLALDFSFDLNQRFTRGQVGNILGRTKDRGVAVADALTLETSLGRGGPRARESVDALLAATRTNPALMRGAVGDFLKDEFGRIALRGGQIDPTGARRFMARFEAVLGRFPELQAEFQASIDTGSVTALQRNRVGDIQGRLRNPKVSRAAAFIERPPERAFNEIAQSNNPRSAVANLVNMAARDTTGRATSGLKTSFTDWLLQRSLSGGTTSPQTGEVRFVSGAKLRENLENPKLRQMMTAMFDEDEVKRLGQIAATAIRMDAARSARPAEEGIIGDVPGALAQTLGRIGGAQIGRIIAGKTGGGTVQTPGILSNAVQRALAAGVKDPASSLLTRAVVEDEELFRALLADASTPERQLNLQKRLNAWLATVLIDTGTEGLSDGAQ